MSPYSSISRTSSSDHGRTTAISPGFAPTYTDSPGSIPDSSTALAGIVTVTDPSFSCWVDCVSWRRISSSMPSISKGSGEAVSVVGGAK